MKERCVTPHDLSVCTAREGERERERTRERNVPELVRQKRFLLFDLSKPLSQPKKKGKRNGTRAKEVTTRRKIRAQIPKKYVQSK